MQTPPVWTVSPPVVLKGTAYLSFSLDKQKKPLDAGTNLRCWCTNTISDSCRLLTAVLLWHAEVLHHGQQQHSRKLQGGWPRQLHAPQNWNHGSGSQAGTAAEAAQAQTSRHERFNTLRLLMAVRKFHFSPTSFLFYPPWVVNLLICRSLCTTLPVLAQQPPPQRYSPSHKHRVAASLPCPTNVVHLWRRRRCVHVALWKVRWRASCCFCSVGIETIKMAYKWTA